MIHQPNQRISDPHRETRRRCAVPSFYALRRAPRRAASQTRLA
jgi:hypothetical protein